MGRCIVKWIDSSIAHKVTHRKVINLETPYFFEVVDQKTLERAYDILRKRYDLRPVATDQQILYSCSIDRETYVQIGESEVGVAAIKIVSSNEEKGSEIAPKVKELAEQFGLPTKSLESFLADKKINIP